MVDKLDEAWRSRGIKNRMEFFRGALGHYLKELGAEDAAALFVDAATAASARVVMIVFAEVASAPADKPSRSVVMIRIALHFDWGDGLPKALTYAKYLNSCGSDPWREYCFRGYPI